MKRLHRQQIAISGVGGQGVLFVTKLLARTAVANGWNVLVSETHGMAQRGGNVISHLKISRPGSAFGFTSPLVRAGHADLVIALHPDAVAAHGFLLKPDGRIFANSPDEDLPTAIDAARIAADLGSPISANLVMTGFAAASGDLFCSVQQVREELERLGSARKEINLKALAAGESAR